MESEGIIWRSALDAWEAAWAMTIDTLAVLYDSSKDDRQYHHECIHSRYRATLITETQSNALIPPYLQKVLPTQPKVQYKPIDT